MTWNKNLPAETNSFSDIPQIAQDNFDATEDIFGIEHYTFGESLCGTHIPGIMGVMESASTAIIIALTSPGSGAMAWDTSKGYWQRYWQGAWGYPGSASKWSRIRAYKSTNQNLTSVDGGTQTATIVFASETYDSLNEFATNTFTPADSGYYLIVAAWCASGGTTSPDTTTTTYPQSGITEKWSASMTSRATADILQQLTTFPTSGADHYSQINEVNCSTTNGLCAATTAGALTDEFQHERFAIPAGATVNRVQTILRAASNPAGFICYGGIRVGATWYPPATTYTPASNNYIINTWATNPATTTAWTVDQINETAGSNNLSGFGVGIYELAGKPIWVYQAYLKVDYTLTNNNYANVDESTTNDNDFLFSAPATSGTANIEVLSGVGYDITAGSPISLSATLNIRAKCLTATGSKLKGVIRCGSTNYSTTTNITLTDDFDDYSFVWDLNPATSTVWTSGDFAGTTSTAISGYGFYISTAALASTAIISQCKLKLDWDFIPSTMSILLRKGGTVTSSATKEMKLAGETDEQIKIMDIIYLSAGQTVDVQAQKTFTNDVILSGTDATYIAIHRLGSQGL